MAWNRGEISASVASTVNKGNAGAGVGRILILKKTKLAIPRSCATDCVGWHSNNYVNRKNSLPRV